MTEREREYAKEYRAKNAEKIRAQQAERDKRKREMIKSDPVAQEARRVQRRKEYREKHPGARTKEEVLANKRIRKPKRTGDQWECIDCHQVKPVAEFARHGSHGRKDYCQDCQSVRSKEARKRASANYEAKNREAVNARKLAWSKANPSGKPRAPRVRKDIVVQRPKDSGGVNHMVSNGWRPVMTDRSYHGIITALVRGSVIAFVSTPSSGVNGLRKVAYYSINDPKGRKYKDAESAEKAM